MSARVLDMLLATHAFDPAPVPGSRWIFHVPFADVTDFDVEDRLLDEVAAKQRIAVLGPVGCGKSSVLEYVLHHDVPAVAPIWISAAYEEQATVANPGEFARHVIREVVRWAAEARTMDAAQRERFLKETSRVRSYAARRETTGFALQLALGWISPELSHVVEQVVGSPEVERSQSEYVAAVDALIALIIDQLGRTPLVVIDDTQRFLGEPAGLVATRFFVDTFAMLAERNCAIAIAIQPAHADSEAFARVAREGAINRQLAIPRLGSAGALAALIDGRVRAAGRFAVETSLLEAGVDPALVELPVVGADAVFEPGWDGVLFDHYDAHANLRRTLTIIDQALAVSHGYRLRTITNAALTDAIEALG